MIQLTYPLNAPFTITQHFGENPADYKRFGLPGHEGIDFTAQGRPTAGEHVLSCAPGTVYRIDRTLTHPYGLHVRIQHQGFKTIYAHLSEVMIPMGFDVTPGMLIGHAGSTGNSTAPHVHVTLKIEGYTRPGWPPEIADPEPYFIQPNLSLLTLQGEGQGVEVGVSVAPIARAIVTVDNLNVRTLPYEKSHITRQLHKGDLINILHFSGDTLWAYIGSDEFIAVQYNGQPLAELQSIP